MAVHSAVVAIAEVGPTGRERRHGVAGNLDSAGDNADDVPLIGDALTEPLRRPAGPRCDIAGAGHSLDTTATWLAWVLALAVAAPPILASRCRGCSCGCGSSVASGRR